MRSCRRRPVRRSRALPSQIAVQPGPSRPFGAIEVSLPPDASGVGAGDGDVRDVGGGDRAGAVRDAAALAARVRLDGDVVGGAVGELGREGEGAVGGQGQVVAAVVLQHDRPGEPGDAAADRVGRARDPRRAAAHPVVGRRLAEGHDPGRAAADAGVGGGDARYAVLQERDRRAGGAQLELRTGRQRAGVVGAAELSPGAGVALVEAELRTAVVPEVDPDVGVLAAVLRADGRADPLPARELRRGELDLRRLVAGVGLRGADVACGCARADHRLRGDRKRAVAHRDPVRPERAVGAIEVVRRRRRGRSLGRDRIRRITATRASARSAEAALTVEALGDIGLGLSSDWHVDLRREVAGSARTARRTRRFASPAVEKAAQYRTNATPVLAEIQLATRLELQPNRRACGDAITASAGSLPELDVLVRLGPGQSPADCRAHPWTPSST